MAQQTAGTHLRTGERQKGKALAQAAADLRALAGRSTGKKALWQLGAAALGAAFSRAGIANGMHPFGVAYAAVAGHPLPAAVGAFGGHFAGGQGELVYSAAVMVVLACRLVLEGTRAARTRSFFPLCAAVALGCTKGVVVLSGGMRAALLLLCELGLCLGFALLLGETRDRRSPLQLWGRLCALLCALLALLPVRLWGVVCPARVAGAFFVLTAGAFGGGAAGACVGTAFGAAMDVAQGQGPFLALTWGVAGLAAGTGGRRERLPAVLCGCAACGMLSVWMYANPAARWGLAECFAAAGILVLLPRMWVLPLDAAFSAASEGLDSVRRSAGSGQTLLGLSDAVAQLGAAMEALWQGAAQSDDLGPVYRAACETACRSCRRRDTCWQQEYGDMKTMLCDLSHALRQEHSVGVHLLPQWFTARCIRPQKLCGAINDAYRSHLRRQAMQQQEVQLHRLMGRQYASLGGLLSDLAKRAGSGTEYDALLESRVRRIVRAYLPRAKTAVCLQGGRLCIDLHLGGATAEANGDHSAMLRSLEGALGVKLLPPTAADSAQGVLLRIRQQEGLAMDTFCAVRKKEGERVSGDHHLTQHTDDGRGILLLSDGMGTGEQAGQLSRRALELVSGFVRWGCGLAESTAAVLPVLAARFEEWGFVTLDLWEINLFTGSTLLLKYGAAPGFLVRDGRLTRLDARALPAGLEPMEGEVPTVRLHLRAGDRVILLSDGVWAGQKTADLICDHLQLEGQELANLLVEQAAKEGGGDDMTVVVAQLREPQTKE